MQVPSLNSKIKKWFRDLLTIVHKDIISTKRVKKYFLGAIIPPMVVLIVFTCFLNVDNPETYRVVLVDEDKSEASHIFSNYVRNITSEFAPWFDVIEVESYDVGKQMLNNIEVLGLIHIPKGFGINVSQSNEEVKATVYLEVQNINNDYVKNYMQRMDEAVLTFNQRIHLNRDGVDSFELVAVKYYIIDQKLETAKQIVIGIIGMYGVISGMFFGAVNVAKEYEDHTMIEISNSPISRTAYIASKQVIAVILGLIFVSVISLILFLTFGIEFRGNVWVVVLSFILSTWIHSCLGGLIGLKAKKTMPAILVSIILTMLFWFFSGGFAPLMILGETTYTISRIFPATYWNEILLAETVIPAFEYIASRLIILTVMTICFTGVFWIIISKEGFRS